MFEDQQARFMAKIEKRENGCWAWKGVRARFGYGVFSIKTRKMLAHRVSYQMFKGPIPAGLTIDHLCRNPFCVNPEHLEAVTLAENVMRSRGPAATNARKTHCKRGHPLSGRNLIVTKSGGRRCRSCSYAANEGARQRREERADQARVDAGLPILTYRDKTLMGNGVGAQNARKTHCPQGHAYTSENTYRDPHRNARICRTCARIYTRSKRQNGPGKAAGERNGSAKLTWEEVRRIRALKASGECTFTELSIMFGISQPQLYRILGGLSWRDSEWDEPHPAA